MDDQLEIDNLFNELRAEREKWIMTDMYQLAGNDMPLSISNDKNDDVTVISTASSIKSSCIRTRPNAQITGNGMSIYPNFNSYGKNVDKKTGIPPLKLTTDGKVSYEFYKSPRENDINKILHTIDDKKKQKVIKRLKLYNQDKRRCMISMTPRFDNCKLETQHKPKEPTMGRKNQSIASYDSKHRQLSLDACIYSNITLTLDTKDSKLSSSTHNASTLINTTTSSTPAAIILPASSPTRLTNINNDVNSTLLVESIDSKKKLFTVLVALQYLLLMKEALRVVKVKQINACKLIKRIFLQHKKKKYLKLLHSLSLPLRFLVKIKIRRKRAHLELIKLFISQFSNTSEISFKYMMRKSYRRLIKCQQTMKKFLSRTNARVEMLHIYWNLYETDYRRRVGLKMLAAAEKSKKIIAKRLAEKNGTHGIHHKWFKVHSNVQSLLLHVDSLTYSLDRSVNHVDSSNNSSNVSNDSKDHDPSCISKEERDIVIRKYLKMKRLMYTDKIQNRIIGAIKATVRGIDDAKELISVINPIDKITDSDAFNRMIKRHLADCLDPSRLKRLKATIRNTPFCYLCSTEYGPTWKQIIEECVINDINDKRKGNKLMK